MRNHAGTRERLLGETAPVSAAQYVTQAPQFGPNLAIDLDFDTGAYIKPDGNGIGWMKLTLDGVHCVSKLVR